SWRPGRRPRRHLVGGHRPHRPAGGAVVVLVVLGDQGGAGGPVDVVTRLVDAGGTGDPDPPQGRPVVVVVVDQDHGPTGGDEVAQAPQAPGGLGLVIDGADQAAGAHREAHRDEVHGTVGAGGGQPGHRGGGEALPQVVHPAIIAARRPFDHWVPVGGTICA